MTLGWEWDSEWEWKSHGNGNEGESVEGIWMGMRNHMNVNGNDPDYHGN